MNRKVGQTEELSLYSEELQENMSLLIYLPVSFSPLYKYSLLIAQDGQDYYRFGRIPRLFEELLGEKMIQNTIFCGIPYTSVAERRKKYHPDGEQHEAYIRFLAHELVPFLDKRYPTHQMGQSRVLAGDSLAGTASLLAALTYPHTFGKVIMHSPFVNDALLHKVSSFEQPSLLELYHVIGREETNVQMTDGKFADFLTPNRKLHALLTEKKFHTFYEEFSGDHRWKYWQPDLKRAVTKMLCV
ncbi:MAG TPA: esterase family protein [Bacillus sp. (in: firmicutes)]|nr:esterase family protein [Bacillus sp. (in: firmicutes)]